MGFIKDHWKIGRAYLDQAGPKKGFVFERKKNFSPKLIYSCWQENLRVPYLLTSVNYFTKQLDIALVGLVGTASMSDFPVVHGLVLF